MASFGGSRLVGAHCFIEYFITRGGYCSVSILVEPIQKADKPPPRIACLLRFLIMESKGPNRFDLVETILRETLSTALNFAADVDGVFCCPHIGLPTLVASLPFDLDSLLEQFLSTNTMLGG